MPFPLALALACAPEAEPTDLPPDLRAEVSIRGHTWGEDPGTVQVYFSAHVEHPSTGGIIPDATVQWVSDRPGLRDRGPIPGASRARPTP
ncbi:MAG: hypothetical protein Q8P18_32150 [Pseudomonadota bacterium]|nr:hypothetical protein [Pseudomonadota bacterium]